jgi:hypothetical protein
MRKSAFGVLALVLVLAACGSNTEQRSATGAGSGIAAGALIAGPVGALVGAAAGGGGGAALDEGVDKKTTDAVEKAKRDDNAASASGSSAAPKRLDADAIRDSLRKDGYANIGAFRREGDIYKATASRDGKRYDLTIDARTGDVRDTRAL